MSRRLIVTAALALSSIGTALAATPTVATLSSPTAKQRPILSSIIWHCEATTCTSASALTSAASTACRDIAKKFGVVTSFRSGDSDFSQEQLAKCNEGIK